MIHIVRLGSPRRPGEGLRLGTVRRPPRGVPRNEYASRDYFDLWMPMLAPSAESVALARSARSDRDWRRFTRRYLREMREPGPHALLGLLVALSPSVNLAVGCYCADEARCHRSLLRKLLIERGARVEDATKERRPPG